MRTLQREYERADGSLVVIYGRRRVGKTTLIKEFIRDKPAMYFLADERLEAVQRRRFQTVLSDYCQDPLLARLTAVFERDGVDIAWAKVTTLGSSVVDVFGIAGPALASADVDAVREDLERDLYAVLPAPAPAKPVSEAS